jgi:hypothetical protein
MAACGILVTSVGTGYAQGFVAGDGSPRATTAPKPFASTITVTTSGKTTGAMTSHYLGLSFESTGLNAGNFDTGGNLPQLLKNLGAGTMRFGGLSVDNDIVSYPQWTGITTRGLAGLARLAKASGWTVFYSEDLADFPADKLQVTADAARVAAGLGSRLAAIGCGNEPHGYIRYGRRPATYSSADYDRDAAACLAAIRQGAPKAPLGGPDLVGGQAWFDPYVKQEAGKLALAGEHLYPGAAAEVYAGQSSLSVATTLLSAPLVRTKETETFRWVTAGAKVAKAKPIMSETNSISSGGVPGVSDTFTAALWAINYSLLGAEYGMYGMNFHNMFFGKCAAYSEICPVASDPRAFNVRPIYYGLLFTHLLGTGTFLPVKVTTGATARNVVAYALKTASGGPRVMVENLASLPTNITLAVGGKATSAKMLRLTAPGLLAKSGVRIQGAAVNATTGVMKAGAPTVIKCSGGKCHLTLPAYTAAIVAIPLPAGLAHLRSSPWSSPTAALIRARWVKAWGKLPSVSPELPICSPNSPRWLL